MASPRDLSVIRRWVSLTIVAGLVIFVMLVILRQLQVYAPPTTVAGRADSVQSLLGTLVSALAAVLGISLAVLFLTAQTSDLARRTRTVGELYRSRELIVALSFFLLALALTLVTLARADLLLASSDYRWVDISLGLTLASFLLLIPVALLQIENLDPRALGRKFARRVTVSAIGDYGLVQVGKDSEGRMRLSLVTHGVTRRLADPLGPSHEVIMLAVESKDRLLLNQLVRILLSPIAKLAGTALAIEPSRAPTLLRTPMRRLRLIRSIDPTSQLLVATHIVHYLIRRARNLRSEWGDRDVARHGFVTALSDLIDSLADARAPQDTVILCELAIKHICVAYADVTPWGRTEPLNDFVETIVALRHKGYDEAADVGGSILGYLRVHTAQLSSTRSPSYACALDARTKKVAEAGTESASAGVHWQPGPERLDPWQQVF